VRDCVTDSLSRIFGEECPAIAALAEEELIEKIAGRVAARLGAVPAAKKQLGNRYLREKGAAAFLGVSVFTLQSWRSRGEPCSQPVTRMGKMVMYSMGELEKYMKMRTV
jgi:phage terminase Nu1 subunit (DNA packaging protein)